MEGLDSSITCSPGASAPLPALMRLVGIWLPLSIRCCISERACGSGSVLACRSPALLCDPAPGWQCLLWAWKGQGPGTERDPLPLQCSAWCWFAEVRKGCCGCSLLLRMMANILRTMARFSPGGTAGSQVVRWSVMALNRETISLLDNSGLRQVLRACPELLSCTICPLCAPVIPVTGRAAEQKPFNSFSGGQVLFVSILKGTAVLFLFSSLARMLNMC